LKLILSKSLIDRDNGIQNNLANLNITKVIFAILLLVNSFKKAFSTSTTNGKQFREADLMLNAIWCSSINVEQGWQKSK